ncbi:MAG: type ISP restriction/modification enzyme, partial [Candidatus Heimdallarchaeota archaeon]
MFIQSDTLSKEIKTNYSAINNSNIIFGNPPYSGHSKNRNYWIDTLLKDKSSYYEINGIPISEKTSKWIQDDYVKFIKFAHSLVEQKGYGIIAFITNHGFIDNPTFRAMRYQLLQFFTNIYILNLHGYYLNNKHDGIKDENIFDIKKGVSINIFVKKQNQKSCEFIHYYEIFGDREKKLDFLQKKSLKTINWSIIKPTPENYFFHKIDQEIYLEYLAGWKIISKNPKDNVIFNKNSVGLLSAQDKVVIQFDKKSLKELLVDFSSKSIEELKSKYPDIEDNSCWKLESAIKDVKDSGEFDKRIKKILYRPFDVRYTYYSGHSTGF